MNSNPKSWKVVRDRHRRENFVGRKEHLSVFKDNFSSEVPSFMIFTITGEGGVGKSTLLQQYINIATAPDINAIVVTCDERYPSPILTMGHIATELAKQDIVHKGFDERYKKYRELREEIESDPKAPRGAIDLLARGATDLAIKSGRKIPGVGIFLEGADEKTAGETLSQLIHYGISRWGNKDEVVLLREPEHVLTPLLLELLAKAAEKRRMVLMFDVFEHIGPSLLPWLLALFNFEYGEFDTNLSFVIAGRDPLDQSWIGLTETICRITLEPFSPDETRMYLGNQEITDDTLVTQTHEVTGGLPVLVALLASTKPQPGVPLPDVSTDAVKRFLQWVPQEDHRWIALIAAVPRYFNRETLSAALNSDATDSFGWLSNQSFVRRNPERGYGYHEKVRELMLRHLRDTAPKDLDDAHSRLTVFFTDAQMKLKLEGRAAYESETWRRLECERIYHIVSEQPDRNIPELVNAYLHAFRWRPGFADEIAHHCRRIGQESGLQSIKRLAGTLLEAYSLYDLSRTTPNIEDIRSIGELGGLTVISRCKLHALLGFFCREEGLFDQALAEYNQAIELDGTYAWAIGGRGLTYCLMDRYEEALSDFNRGIELDEKYIFAYESRGETYYLMGRYEEASADFNRVVDLGGEDASVFVSRGEFYQSVGKYEEALSDFNRAIEIAPESPCAVEGRGLTYRLLGKYEEALADYIRANALEPDEFGINLGLIACYRRLGFTDDYERQVAKARQVAADEGDYSRACFMALTGDVDKAFTLLISALESGPDTPDWVRRDPDFDWIRDDPRMEALLREIETGKGTTGFPCGEV
jgi:tetratricopeptide (TPR) repeat protein